MITLALQIFLLLLSAYLAGCMVGCILRRALHEPKMAPVAVPVDAKPRAPLPPDTTSSCSEPVFPRELSGLRS